jgi:hypothetical protein
MRIPFSSLFDVSSKGVGMVSPSPTEEIVGGIVAPGGLGKSVIALETCRLIEVGKDLFGPWGTLLA